jgi:hypothetical protein
LNHIFFHLLFQIQQQEGYYYCSSSGSASIIPFVNTTTMTTQKHKHEPEKRIFSLIFHDVIFFISLSILLYMCFTCHAAAAADAAIHDAFTGGDFFHPFTSFKKQKNNYVHCVRRIQGRILPHNISLGVIISNHSLVLQSVSRTTAGNYSCVGYNSEGDGESLPFELNVMCK